MLIHPGWLVHASRSTRAALLARYTPMELDPMSEAQVMAMMDAVDNGWRFRWIPLDRRLRTGVLQVPLRAGEPCATG